MHKLKTTELLVPILLTVLLYGCEKELPELNPEKKTVLAHTDSIAISQMPYYYSFLTTMKNEGYQFMDFRTFISEDSADLPEKLIVIRHDVHYRDISWAYYAFQIERSLIGPGKSTFFIMLNDPEEMSQSEHLIEPEYLWLIHYLLASNQDVQPHISPIDLYVNSKHPSWSKDPVGMLQNIFDHNYRWDVGKKGRRLIVTGTDLLHLNTMNHDLGFLLKKYNHEWTRQTGLPVEGYASHGSASNVNKVINNAYILDQMALLNSGIFEYDAYNSKIMHVLTYLSDNTMPSWMHNPASIKPGRYQLLMHPYQWSVNRPASGMQMVQDGRHQPLSFKPGGDQSKLFRVIGPEVLLSFISSVNPGSR